MTLPRCAKCIIGVLRKCIDMSLLDRWIIIVKQAGELSVVEIFIYLVFFQAKKAKRQDIFKRAEKYAKEYEKADRELIKNKRDARKANNYFVPAQPKVAFVMRIRGYVYNCGIAMRQP